MYLAPHTRSLYRKVSQHFANNNTIPFRGKLASGLPVSLDSLLIFFTFQNSLSYQDRQRHLDLCDTGPVTTLFHVETFN